MTDILRPRNLHLPRSIQVPPTYSHNEEMEGCLSLHRNRNTFQRVQVKIYRTSVGHFAIIYPLNKIQRPLATLNLKHTLVEKQEDGFILRQCGVDSPLSRLTFRAEANELDQWVNAFSSKVCHPATPPIITEEDES